MNNILSIKLGANLDHDMHEKHVQQIVPKMRRNEQNLRLHIIKGWGMF